MAKEKLEDDIFDDKNEVQVQFNTIKFGKIADWFKGTLVANDKKIKNQLSAKGEMQTIYELRAKGGFLHLINDKIVDKEATVPEANDIWSYITGNEIQLRKMKKVKIGQLVGLKFVEERPSKKKGFNATKIINVYPGAMDEEFLKEQNEDDGIDFK